MLLVARTPGQLARHCTSFLCPLGEAEGNAEVLDAPFLLLSFALRAMAGLVHIPPAQVNATLFNSLPSPIQQLSFCGDRRRRKPTFGDGLGSTEFVSLQSVKLHSDVSM